MRLTIIFIFILILTGMIFYLTESKEIEEVEQIERLEAEQKAKEAEQLSRLKRIRQYQDSTIQAIFDTPNIDSVDLSGLELTELPSVFKNLRKLKYLNLSNNRFKNFPTILMKLPNLETVDLSVNEIEELTLSEYCYIKHLDLSGNKIKEFCATHRLPKLETFNLSYNLLGTLVDFERGYSVFPNLKSLNISYNQIQDIRNVYIFKNLKFLNVSSNQLYEWRLELPTTLEYLDLSDNKISELRNIEGSLDFSNLRELNLSHNEIRTFYRDLPFQNIERLILKENYLYDISVFSAYKKLTFLDLEGCQMGTNPVKIDAAFKKIDFINLGNNGISIFELDNNHLEYLIISLNKFQHLDEIHIRSATNLKLLDISGIPFSEKLDMKYIRKFNQPNLEQIVALNPIFQDAEFRNRFKAAINPKTEIIYEY
jgi:Leucine-rich repeat (LRR) protein